MLRNTARPQVLENSHRLPDIASGWAESGGRAVAMPRIAGTLAIKFHIFKELLNRERYPGYERHRTPRKSPASLDNDRFSHHRIEILPEAYHPRNHAVGWSKIQEQHMVAFMMNDLVERSNQFRVPPPAEPALEYG